MKLIGYVRVSTTEQAKDGASLDAQEADISNYCALYEHELIHVIRDEGESGKSLQRPGVQEAIELVESGSADGLIITKLDRLSRSVRDLLEVAESRLKDKSIISVREQFDTTTAAGRLVFNMLASVAQWERETIADRVSQTLQYLKSKGVWLGRVPYGYTRTEERDTEGRRIIVENQEEQSILKYILTCRSYQKPISYHRIADLLNKGEIKPRFADKWSAQTIHNIATRGKIKI